MTEKAVDYAIDSPFVERRMQGIPNFMNSAYLFNMGDKSIHVSRGKDSDVIEIKTEYKISDGYHTFDELYEHRYKLFAVMLCLFQQRTINKTWMSKLHEDGSMYDDMFVAGATINDGENISYHLPMSEWEDLAEVIPVLDKAPPFDGHTSFDVLNSLTQYLRSLA